MSSPPTWSPLRLESPEPLRLDGGRSGTVALVPSPGVRDGWSARAALALAGAMTARGEAVVLCDLALEDPELHEAAGIANAEGVSDMLLFGASPRHVARPVEGGVHLAPAGTVVADPAGLRASPRWDALVDAFQEAEGRLLLYVPAGAPGADAVLARADHVVALRRADEPDDLLELGEARARLHAVLGPVEETAALATAVGSDAPTGSGAPERASDGAPGEPTHAPEPAPSRPSPSRRAAESKSSGFRLFFILLAILALVLVLAASLGWIRLPGLAGSDGGSSLAAQEVSSTGAAAGRDAREPLYGWALALESFLDAEVAARRAREFQERHPGHLFWVVPVRVDGRRFHRVLAGQRQAEGDLQALRTALGGNSAWYARRVEWAFLLGELPELEAARTWSDALAELGIPTHVLQVGDGTTPASYRVFAGGYASAEEAREMEAMLREQDLASAPLTERRGIVPE